MKGAEGSWSLQVLLGATQARLAAAEERGSAETARAVGLDSQLEAANAELTKVRATAAAAASWGAEFISAKDERIRSLESEKGDGARALAKALRTCESLEAKISVSLTRAEIAALEAAEGWAAEQRSAEAEKEALEEQLAEVRLTNTDLGEKLATATAESNRLSVELAFQRGAVVTAEAALAPLTERVADLEREKSSLCSEAERVRESLAAAERREAEQRTKLEEMRSTAAATGVIISTLEGRVRELTDEKSTGEAALVSARTQIATLREESRQLQQRLEARDLAEVAVAEARAAEQAAAAAAKREAEERLKEFEEQLSKVTLESATAVAEAGRLRQAEIGLRSSLREAEVSLAAVRTSLNTTTAAAGAARTALAALRVKTEKASEAATAEHRRLAGELLSLRGSTKSELDAAAEAARTTAAADVEAAVAPLRVVIGEKEEAAERLKLEHEKEVLGLLQKVERLEEDILKFRRESLNGDNDRLMVRRHVVAINMWV